MPAKNRLHCAGPIWETRRFWLLFKQKPGKPLFRISFLPKFLPDTVTEAMQKICIKRYCIVNWHK